MNEEIIKYTFTSLEGSETLIVSEDAVIYEKNELKITSNNSDTPQKLKKIEIKDKFFADSMVLGNAYMPLKKEIIKKYTEVQKLAPKDLHRTKNTAHKTIQINDRDLKINVDMYITEYGDIFEKLVSLIKGLILSELKRK